MRSTVIGSCEIIQGDSIKLMREMQLEVDHMIFDPPYDEEAHVQYRPRRRGKGGAEDRQQLDFSSIDARTAQACCETAARLCRGWFITFCQTEMVSFWRDHIEAERLKYKTPCVWVKPDATPKFNGQGPAIGYESFVTAWAGEGYARWNAGGKRGVYTHLTNSSTRHGAHPTEKPLGLMRELVQDFTEQGQTILDPFAGSGTTGVAAMQLGRKCILIEKNPEYFDICCQRVQDAARNVDLFIPQAKPKQDDMGFPRERIERTKTSAA